jgi:dephospho-CoA kinase
VSDERPVSKPSRRAPDPARRTPDPARRPLRIGITGPIGCGKSTVAGWLGERGAVVSDADRVAREVTPAGSPELAAIVAAFGRGVLQPDGELDRGALGRLVFADTAALARLEAIVHPAVRPRILALIAGADRAGPPAVVIEAIKLVEGGLAGLCDEVWLVTCDPPVQRDRVIARARGRRSAAGTADGDAAAADSEARIAAQGDLVARLLPRATRVIDTSGSIAESRSRVEAAWTEATELARP